MLPLEPNEHKHWDHQTKQSVALCKDNHMLLALPHSSKENNILKPPGTLLLMMQKERSPHLSETKESFTSLEGFIILPDPESPIIST